MSDSSTPDYMSNISCRLSIVVARNFPKDMKFVNLNLELDLKKHLGNPTFEKNIARGEVILWVFKSGVFYIKY